MNDEQLAWFQIIMDPIYERTEELFMSLGPESAVELDKILGELKGLVRRVAIELW